MRFTLRLLSTVPYTDLSILKAAGLQNLSFLFAVLLVRPVMPMLYWTKQSGLVLLISRETGL